MEFFSSKNIEVKDPSREACLIYIGKDGKETHREYFGNNPRIEIKGDLQNSIN